MIRQKNGYSLVLIVLMSTFILALLAGAMRVVTQSYVYSQEEYYYKLAQEANTVEYEACTDHKGAHVRYYNFSANKVEERIIGSC